MKLLAASFFALWAVGNAAPSSVSNPKVRVRNGTYVGVRNANYQQDFFLGMPYAQQPVGNLRFKVPHSLNESWEGERDAKKYSDICVGYGVSQLLSLWQKSGKLIENSRTPFGIRCLKLVSP
jgi:triacylglycerol lipase